MLSGKAVRIVNCNLSDRICDIKTQIAPLLLPPTIDKDDVEIELTFRGKKLNDVSTLSACGIDDEAELVAVIGESNVPPLVSSSSSEDVNAPAAPSSSSTETEEDGGYFGVDFGVRPWGQDAPHGPTR